MIFDELQVAHTSTTVLMLRMRMSAGASLQPSLRIYKFAYCCTAPASEPSCQAAMPGHAEGKTTVSRLVLDTRANCAASPATSAKEVGSKTGHQASIKAERRGCHDASGLKNPGQNTFYNPSLCFERGQTSARPGYRLVGGTVGLLHLQDTFMRASRSTAWAGNSKK